MRTFAPIFLNQLGGGGGVALVGLSGTGTGVTGVALGRETLPRVVEPGAFFGGHEASIFQKRLRLGSPWLGQFVMSACVVMTKFFDAAMDWISP